MKTVYRIAGYFQGVYVSRISQKWKVPWRFHPRSRCARYVGLFFLLISQKLIPQIAAIWKFGKYTPLENNPLYGILYIHSYKTLCMLKPCLSIFLRVLLLLTAIIYDVGRPLKVCVQFSGIACIIEVRIRCSKFAWLTSQKNLKYVFALFLAITITISYTCESCTKGESSTSVSTARF